MTSANFPAVMAHVFREEGGYVDHPKDPGGATNMGITHITLAEYRGRPVSKADVKALTKAEATEIYRKRYWNAIKGDDLPAGIDLVMMDGSVNSGANRGPKWVQAALRVAQDGKVGRQTIDAAWTANAADTINAACDARLVFLQSLSTWNTFGKGWRARVGRVRKEALAMAEKSPNAPYNPPPEPEINHYEPPVAPLPMPPREDGVRKSGNPAIAIIAVIVVLGALAALIGPRLLEANMFLDIAQRVAVEYVIMPILLTIVTAAIGWASVKWQQWTGQQIEEKKKRDLHMAAENAIRLAIQTVLDGLAPTTESQRQAVLQAAPQYVAKTVPGALAHFKIDPQGSTLKDILTTKLPIVGIDTEKTRG